MNSSQSAALKAFLLKLRGSSGRFFFGDLELNAPQDSTLSGAITIQSGSTARDIIINAPTTGDFSVGDRIQIGTDNTREYKMIVEVNSPNTLRVESMIRRIDYVGLTVNYTAPTGVFMLDSDNQASWGITSKALLSDINLSFVEAF
jgi:hypothetical protein